MGWQSRVREAEVARILQVIATPPNVRDQPRPGDLTDGFDNHKWFDGGIITENTGSVTYKFADGVEAVLAVAPFLWVIIHFPNGETVTVLQGTHP